jgi:hypothetical protein
VLTTVAVLLLVQAWVITVVIVVAETGVATAEAAEIVALVAVTVAVDAKCNQGRYSTLCGKSPGL